MLAVHLWVTRLARLSAILGGLVLTILIVIICASIIGRTLNAVMHSALDLPALAGLGQWVLDLGVGSIRGDFEIVEAGMAFCIFAFLPLCQVTAGHASVDVFTNFLPRGVNRVLSFLIELLFAVALVVIAMQLKEGLDRNMRSGQTTLLLQYPVWWGYALSYCAAVAAALAGVYMALLRLFEMFTGHSIVAQTGGADH